MQPALIEQPKSPIAWSDLAPRTGPRADTLKAGDIVRKVMVAVATPASIDRDKMELEAVISGEAKRDSYGDITRADGWDFERWLKNPVVMWAHNYSIPPIGAGLSIEVKKPNVVSRMRFWGGDGEWGDFAREIFSMYANDPPFMRAFSVGFMPTKWNAMYEETEGGGRVFVGYDYLEKELWEYSAVPIPAYPDALSKAAQAGQFVHVMDRLQSLAGPEPRAESPARPDELAELKEVEEALDTLGAKLALDKIHAVLHGG